MAEAKLYQALEELQKGSFNSLITPRNIYSLKNIKRLWKRYSAHLMKN